MRALIKHGLNIPDTPPLLITQNAYSIARIALKHYKSGQLVSDNLLAPTYLRLPQAERERLEKLNAKDDNK